MIMYLKVILPIIVAIFCIVFVYINIKKAKSLTEKILYILLLFIYFVPYILYLLDSYNLPTKIGYANKINVDRWFSFISNYVSTIVGTVVSGVILVLITFKQIEVQKNDNREDKRIQNAPLMKYDISNNVLANSVEKKLFNSEGKIYHFFFEIENIGLNHAKKIDIKLQSDDGWSRCFNVGNNQSILKKGEKYVFDYVINYKKNSDRKKKITILINYFDMLNNQYEQQINIDYYVNNEERVECRGLQLSINNIEICDEIYKQVM